MYGYAIVAIVCLILLVVGTIVFSLKEKKLNENWGSKTDRLYISYIVFLFFDGFLLLYCIIRLIV